MEREELDGDLNLPKENQHFIQLQKKINILLNNNQESKFLLKAIKGTSNGSFIINCIQTQINSQTQTFKITKNQAGILDAVKNYYANMKKQQKKEMNRQSQAYRQMTDTIQSFKSGMNEGLDSLYDFEADYIQNVAVLQQTISKSIQSLRDQLFNARDIKQYSKSSLANLQQQLRNQIIDLLRIFLPKDHQNEIEDVLSGIFKDNTVSCQAFLYEIRNSLKDGVAQRIVNIIQQFDSYKALRDYGVDDINLVKIQFANEFYDRFSITIPFKIVKEMINSFMENPQYQFTNRTDLTHDQKKELVNALWLDEKSILIKLIKAYKYKDTLDFKINQDIQTILNNLIFTNKYNLSSYIEQIKKDLEESDLIRFFDQTEFVSNQNKKIYEFIGSNCKDYMKKHNGFKCTTNLRIDSQIKLKKKLQEMIQYIPYDYWGVIEEQIMKGNLNIIEKYVNNEDTVFKLRQWIHKQLSKYLQTIMQKQTLKQKAKTEVTQFLVKKGIRGLSFKQIDTLVNDLLESPYFQVIQASRILTDQYKRDLKTDFPKLQRLGQYCRFRKIDLQSYQIPARMKIEEQANKIKPRIPHQIKQKIISMYLKHPKDSTLYEQENISTKWKIAFLEAVKKIPQVTEYIEKFDIFKCIEKREAYLSKLKSIFKPQDFEAVKQYVCVHGEIPIKDGKFTQATNKELIEVFKALSQDNLQKFREAQSSNQFKQFLEELPEIAKYIKEEFECRMTEIVKKLFSPDHSEQDEIYLTNIIKEQLKKNTASSIIDHQAFQLSLYSDLKTALLQEPRYKRLVALEKNISNNQKLFYQLKLKKKIKEIYHHQAFMNINPEEKMKIIEKILSSFQFEEIRKYKKITDEQKDKLIQFIKESNQYKQFNQSKGINANAKKVEVKRPQPSLEQKPPKSTTIIDSRNPQVKVQQKKPQEAQAAQITEESRFVQQFVEPRIIEESVIASISAEEKNAILTKWETNLTLFKQKSQYKNGKEKEKEYKQNPNKLVELILEGFPWTEETSVAFWKCGPKKTLHNDLKLFAEKYRQELQADVKLLFTK